MGAEMRWLRLTKLLLCTLLTFIIGATCSDTYLRDKISASRIQRDLDGVTTVLLVPAQSGKSAPPIGILSKTARTFVQDGASTEYATQVLGTTLDNGRLYAKILSTSSRIYYDKEPSPDPSSPYIVYPSTNLQNNWPSQFPFNDEKMKTVEKINNENDKNKKNSTMKEELNELKDNDIFRKRENHDLLFKPAKVRTENLPTYTVKQDYVLKGSDIMVEEEQPKSFRFRAPKVFRPQPKVSMKKQEIKPLATVTYHGFADFVTTVGDTVIVFSPSTSPVPIGRPPTTIKGDATLRPDDGIAVVKIRPSAVLIGKKKTENIQIRNHNPTNEFLLKNLKQSNNTNILDLQPSTVEQQETEFLGEKTSPLLLVPDVKTGLQNPTGLLKVIDSTATVKGITTHYMSSIYGTYIGSNYAQIVHTSSNVYFHPDDSTKTYNLDGNSDDSESSIVLLDSNTSRQPNIENNSLNTINETILKEVMTENYLGNDIVPRNQGRSIKDSSQKNQFAILKGHKQRYSENKLSLVTNLLPSTIYKTFTYFTTFFIPSKGQTSTSIRSREVTSSEITLLPEVILPTNIQIKPIVATTLPKMTTNKVEISSNIDLIENTNNPEKQEIEEIQLIFKTIFTTFTYLTTFYDDSTTSISSRKVTATNVITHTVDPDSSSVEVDLLNNKDEPTSIVPTKTLDISFSSSKDKEIDSENINNNNNYYYETTEETTENILTTISDEFPITEKQLTTEMMNESEKDKNDNLILLEPSPITTASMQLLNEQLKTYYTTYTYFTTIIVDDESEIETRTEVFSNIVTENIQPTTTQSLSKTSSAGSISKPAPPPEILAYLEALNKQKSPEEALSLAKMVQVQIQVTTEEINEITTENPSVFTTTDETTFLDDLGTTDKIINDREIIKSMKTDVIFTSSSGGRTVLDIIDKKNNVPEDQELSETNHHDVEPAPTLLLQTSYTTYTYFTTMYNGDATDVVSRLKTVTNIVTETIRPTAVIQPELKTFQPLTYFTTFTYWTTFIKGDETATTSREETVSNIIKSEETEKPSIQLDVIKTYRPFVVATPVHSSTELKATSDNEVTTSPNIILKEIPTIKINELSSTISPEPMTLYTTYTYFTTSYTGNSTILKSRLETITSVSYPDDLIVKATPRVIGGLTPSSQILNTEEKPIQSNKIVDSPKTGLLSTIRLSNVNQGTTTHFMTDIYGTYIDGLYAQVLETSTKIELPVPVYTPSATPVLSTGILSINQGSIIDADEITTIYYTTKQIGTSVNDIYAKVIESTSTTKIDEQKLATRIPIHGHRTGLVRLIKGLIEANDTTTYYQSRVIGTSIDGRYAQIIESTSSFLSSKPTPIINIAPSSTLTPTYKTGILETLPSPAVIQSSISDDHSMDILNNDSDLDENENEDDDDDDQKLKKKSRLTFSSRKRTSTAPPIRPFASRSRPTFNPKRKPQGATTITRSDITPTITATLAGKGNRFASSRGRIISPSVSTIVNASSSRRFSGRRSSLPSTSLFSTNHPSGSSRNRGVIRVTPSSLYSGSRRISTSIRGTSIRPSNRGSSLISSLVTTRYRPGIRPSTTVTKFSSTIKQDDQEDNANEFTTSTFVTEEIPLSEETGEDPTIPPYIQTTTESLKKTNNPLLRFRRPPAFGSGVRTTTPKATAITKTPKRINNLSRQNIGNRGINNRTRPTISTLTTRTRQSQSSLFPPRSLFGKKPDTTEAPIENKSESEVENEEQQEQQNLEDKPVEEIIDNDYEGSEQKESAQSKISNINKKPNSIKNLNFVSQIKPFTKIGRSRRIRRQTRQLNSRFRRPTAQIPNIEDRIDIDVSSSKEDLSKIIINNSRYGTRGRSLSSNSRLNLNGNKEDKSSEEYIDTSNISQIRSRAKSIPNRNSIRVKPTVVNTNRQFTLRDKESTTALKSTYKRPASSSRTSNLRSRNNLRPRTSSSRYQDATNLRRTSSRTLSRNGVRTNNRRIVPSRGRISSHEDYRDFNDFDGTITVTHYVPTEITIPVVNNGITEKRNIITAQASTEIIGPDRYNTITNSDGQDIVVLASEMTGTNYQGHIEITRFIIHETPTTKVSHMLTSSGVRRFSQAVVVPSTIYSIENIVSTLRPHLPDNAPNVANILLSQLLLGQFGQQNQLVSGVPIITPSTRYDTHATTYLTTLTKHQSTIIPLTFRGKEILTTLVDSTIDIVTATELITDTVIVTPTVALPAANLNSLLLLLQQPQAPQQSNPLLDPFAAAPLLTQSNTLPGEVERRNQPVDFDYKPESYEDLSEEDNEKSSKTKGKLNTIKINEKEMSESSIITLYVSGRKPGEFSTVLSTVKIGEESLSTKVKRHLNEETVNASHSPSLQLESEPSSYILTGSEEPIDTHAPTQSLESVVGDRCITYVIRSNGQRLANSLKSTEKKGNGLSCYFLQDTTDETVFKGLQDFGKKTRDVDYYNPEEDEYISKKRVRVRVPVTRLRSTREHALTVVRRRPLVLYTRSSSSQFSENILSPTHRRIITRTKIRNPDAIDVGNKLSNDISNDIYTNTNRHKFTVTRRRKIKPSTTFSSYRERITRKKLVTVRPVPEPTSTLAIITTGFYTAPSVDDNEEYYEDIDSRISTPELNTLLSLEHTLISTLSKEIKHSLLNLEKESSTSDPIIITDNFFFPEIYEESTSNMNKDNFEKETTTMINEFNEETTTSDLKIKNLTEKFTNIDSTTEIDFETTTNLPDITDTTFTSVQDFDSTTFIENDESTNKSLIEYNIDFINTTSKYNEKILDINVTVGILPTTLKIMEDNINDNNLRVIPITKNLEKIDKIIPNITQKIEQLSSTYNFYESNHDLFSSDIPTVIPLEVVSSFHIELEEKKIKATSILDTQLTTTSISLLTPEDIEAGLTDDLYLSLSRPDFPQIIPSQIELNKNKLLTSDLNQNITELQTSVYYSETIVTSTRLRTYTYVVTKLNGQDTEVKSSTTVRPRVTSLTLTVPVTVTITPSMISSEVAFSSSLVEPTKNNEEIQEEGRRFNLATRVMSNGVEVIVADTTPAYRWENSNPQPTLTLSEAVKMLLPQDKLNDFVTKTCLTTFTYLNTITLDGTMIVSTDQQVIANTATEERHRKPASEAVSFTLEASPTLQTEVFKTTYTYLTLNTDHPNEINALGSSIKIISNTITAPKYYLDMILEPSEVQRPETNTYFSTSILEKTYIEDGKTRVGTTNDIVTQLIITESAQPFGPPSINIAPSLTASDENINPSTDVAKTYYITYTYYNTYLEKDKTIVKTNVATSSDIVYEKASIIKTTSKSAPIGATLEPIQIFATKTYLTTYTYFTTLLQAGPDGETSTAISSHSKIVENVVTESIAPSLLDADYMNALLTSTHHSDSLKNVVTGSTIIFFDDEEQVTPTAASIFETTTTSSIDKIDSIQNSSVTSVQDSNGSETNDVTTRPIERNNSHIEEAVVEEYTEPPQKKTPSVSNLLSLGSLGINSLSALGPVITAMAGLLQGKSSATHRNDTQIITEPPVITTQRSPIYIPVGEFIDGDIETAESQNIALQLGNNNHLPETRHKVTSSLADGIPISPGEVITANSDVIIGKPGKLAPRPPQTFINDESIGMKPPPMSVPNISVHPVLEVLDQAPAVSSINTEKDSDQLEIIPAHQIYEEHIKIPINLNQATVAKKTQNSHQVVLNTAPKTISSKKDILENDPLLLPPSISANVNSDLKTDHLEKYEHTWSTKEHISSSNILVDESNQPKYPQNQHTDILNESNLKPHILEPIVHQVPHVIDRSTGQPLLVNIQPSQVANVVIPQGGTQALIFGDTSEPHITGQYFDDPSPYPEPEVGPSFIGINKVENLSHYSKNENPVDYMTPPSKNLQVFQDSNTESQLHNLPVSQNINSKHFNIILKPDKIIHQQYENVNLSTGNNPVHSEILVRHEIEGGYLKPQSRPSISMHNYQNFQSHPNKEFTKIHVAIEKVPPRRAEIQLSTQNPFYDLMNIPVLNLNWKNEKKPLRNSPIHRPRPTTRPQHTIRISGRPYNRPISIKRPLNSIRQPQSTYLQKLPANYYQNELSNQNQQFVSPSSLKDSIQQVYTAEISEKDDIKNGVTQYHQTNYENTNFQEKKNHSIQNSDDYMTEDYHLNIDLKYNNPPSKNDNYDSISNIDKAIDSEVDASENIKVTSKPQKSENEEDYFTNSEINNFESTTKFEYNNYFYKNISINDDHVSLIVKPLQNNSTQIKTIDNVSDGEIIIGSEKKENQYFSYSTLDSMQNTNKQTNVYGTDFESSLKQNFTDIYDIADLKPPGIIKVFEPNGHSRPYSNFHIFTSNSKNTPEIITESPEQNNNIRKGHIRPGLGQIVHVQSEQNEGDTKLKTYRNESLLHSFRERYKSDYVTRIHPNHPQIITKSKPQIPAPVIVSNGNNLRQNFNHKRPSIQFSLPIDSIGEENESKTQTERAPSVNATTNNKIPNLDFISTTFENDFVNIKSKHEKNYNKDIGLNISNIEQQQQTPDMVPLSISLTENKNIKIIKNQVMDEVLKPPPSPTDVVGLSPPPVDITTTRPLENQQNQPKLSSDVSGLKPPPLYIPLKEISKTPPLPSMNMVPPNPRPSVIRPYLADILSEDMVSTSPDVTTTRPLEMASVLPGVAVSGSIQIATAVATSHIPVIQDMESKIPIVHGTVDLPVLVNVPEFIKPIDVKTSDRVSIYTVRPFETRERHTVRPTPSLSTPSIVKQSQINIEQQNVQNYKKYTPNRLSSSHALKKLIKQPEISIMLEPSTDIQLSTTKIEPTVSLSVDNVNNKKLQQRPTKTEISTKFINIENTKISTNSVSASSTQIQKDIKTALKIKESASKMMEIIGTVVHEFIQNSTNENLDVKPEHVTHFETLTVTRTETSILGSTPTIRTLLITHTLASTRIETVTEILLRPTSVISTITSTILQSIPRVPSYENGNDNESIFVIMSDQKPPSPGAEEVEAEYGEDDISRDEQDISTNEIHRVLSGGILGAPSIPIRPPRIQCVPECKASKSEICAESNGEMRCICRHGFARMFPDRPCKPTYTYTVGIGLDRFGREQFKYDSIMNDTNSVAFRRYAHPMKDALDRTLMQSDLRDIYRNLNIVKFSPNPPKVIFNIQLTSNTDETKLKDIIRKYLVMSNYSLGGTDVYAAKDLGLIEANDFDECTAEDGGPYHDCSQNAACFNLKGSYQCSCKEGWADLSENPTYPGRTCSQAPLGCSMCNNKGQCVMNTHGQEVCECFPWHSGQKCQINLKVLLIALVTTGAILLGLLAICMGMACFRSPNHRHISTDRRAMISRTGCDTSSEGSAELAIPYHVPHVLPPPPQMVAPAPPIKKPVRKISGKPRRALRKAAPTISQVLTTNNSPSNEQRDRSLTVMIPRAKYRSVPQCTTQNYKPMSTFAVDEHKLIEYLDGGSHPGNRKSSLISNSDYKESEQRISSKKHTNFTASSGALVSAGFQVSATVSRPVDAESTLARSCGETTLEPLTKVIRNTDFPPDGDSTLVRSCTETTIQDTAKQLLRLDLTEAGSTLARSCGETTVHASTKIADRKDCNRDTRDSASECHTMAERDLGSTLRLPAQHAPIYNQDRTNSDRESNFDSL